jgi:uncharacterized protein with GYD domain
MPALLLHGNYTPAAWASIKSDPDIARSAVAKTAAAAGCRMAGYWLAFDEFDFYSVVEGTEPAALAAVRHLLMSTGSFGRLFGEPLFAPDEMLHPLQRHAGTGTP